MDHQSSHFGPQRSRSIRQHATSKPYARHSQIVSNKSLTRVSGDGDFKAGGGGGGLKRSDSTPSTGAFGWLKRLIPFSTSGTSAVVGSNTSSGSKIGIENNRKIHKRMDVEDEDDDEEEFGNVGIRDQSPGLKRTHGHGNDDDGGGGGGGGGGHHRSRSSPSPTYEAPPKRIRRFSPTKPLDLNYSRPTRGWNDVPSNMIRSSPSSSALADTYSSGVKRGGAGSRGLSGSGGGGGIRRSETMGDLGGRAREGSVTRSMGRNGKGGSWLGGEVDPTGLLVPSSPFQIPAIPSRSQFPHPTSSLRNNRITSRESITPAPLMSPTSDIEDEDSRMRRGGTVGTYGRGTPGVSLGMSRMGFGGQRGEGSVKSSRSMRDLAPVSMKEIEAMENRHQSYSQDILDALAQMSSTTRPSGSTIPPSLSSRTLRRAAVMHVPAPSPSSKMVGLGTSARRTKQEEVRREESVSVSAGPYSKGGRKKFDSNASQKREERESREEKMDKGEEKEGRPELDGENERVKSPVKEIPSQSSIPSFLLQEPTTVMKPLPVSLSPSARNMPARSGGRGTSALRASSAKINSATAARKQASGSRPRQGAFGISDDMGDDEFEQAEARKAEEEAEKEKVGSRDSTASAPPPTFTVRQDVAPVEQASLPLTPGKVASARGFLSIGEHAPRASSPLAQQPPVTASPDSSVAATPPAAQSAFSFGAPEASASSPQPPTSAPLFSFAPSADKPAADRQSTFSFATAPASQKDNEAKPAASPFEFGAFNGKTPAPKAESMKLGLGKPSTSATSPFSFAPSTPASSSSAEVASTTPQAPPPSNPFGSNSFGGSGDIQKHLGPASSAAPSASTNNAFAFGAPKQSSSAGISSSDGPQSSFWSTQAAKPVAPPLVEPPKPSPANPLFANGFGSSTPPPGQSNGISKSSTAPISFSSAPPANPFGQAAVAAPSFSFGSSSIPAASATAAAPSFSFGSGPSTASPFAAAFAPASSSPGFSAQPTSNPFAAIPPAAAPFAFSASSNGSSAAVNGSSGGLGFGAPAAGGARFGSVGPSEGSIGGTPPPMFNLGADSGGPPSSPSGRRVKGMPARRARKA